MTDDQQLREPIEAIGKRLLNKRRLGSFYLADVQALLDRVVALETALREHHFPNRFDNCRICREALSPDGER